MDCEEDIDDCLASEYASQLLCPQGTEEHTGLDWRQPPLHAKTGHPSSFSHVSNISIFTIFFLKLVALGVKIMDSVLIISLLIYIDKLGTVI